MHRFHLSHLLYRMQKGQYLSSKKEERKKIAKNVVNIIKSKQIPGRFLQFNSCSDCWTVVDDTRAIDKACQALRDSRSIKIPPIASGSKRNLTTSDYIESIRKVAKKINHIPHTCNVRKYEDNEKQKSGQTSIKRENILSVDMSSYDSVIFANLENYYQKLELLPTAAKAHQSQGETRKTILGKKTSSFNKGRSQVHSLEKSLEKDDEFEADIFIAIMNSDKNDTVKHDTTSCTIAEN